MRPLELAFLAAIVLVGHIAGQLPILACLALAFGIVAAGGVAAKWRHRLVFRRTVLRGGDQLLSFGQPANVWGNPIPYAWWRCRSWYKARIQSADGKRLEYWVMAEGVFFGLFRISLHCELA